MQGDKEVCPFCSAPISRKNLKRHIQQYCTKKDGIPSCSKCKDYIISHEAHACPSLNNKISCSGCEGMFHRAGISRHRGRCKATSNSSSDCRRIELKQRKQLTSNFSTLLARLTDSPNFPDLLSDDAQNDDLYSRNNSFFRKLAGHTQLAKPDNWFSLLKDRSINDLAKHEWNQRDVDFTLVCNEKELCAALEAGLQYPVLIPAELSLDQHRLYINDTPSHLSDLTFSQLLDIIFRNGDTVDVQNHSANDISDFTVRKSCEETKRRFNTPLDQRGRPWNCLEVDDTLFSTFPGPPLLKGLDFLERLQSHSISEMNLDLYEGNSKSQHSGMARKDPSSSWIRGAKKLDRWLLVSEKKAMSKDHIDVVVATWIRCIRGEKIFWFRRELTGVDIDVWKMCDDPRAYKHAWAAITLREGDIFIFPPGMIHAVYTSKDSICAGGHFLMPSVMDRAISVLKTLELKPELTNDNIPVDIFKVFFEFSRRLLETESYNLSSHQLASYVCALESYVHEAYNNKAIPNNNDHFERKKKFLETMVIHDIVRRLLDLMEYKFNPINGNSSLASVNISRLEENRTLSESLSISHGKNENENLMISDSKKHSALDTPSSGSSSVLETAILSSEPPTAAPHVIVDKDKDGFCRIMYHTVNISVNDINILSKRGRHGYINDALLDFYLWFLRDQAAKRKQADCPVLSTYLVSQIRAKGTVSSIEGWTKFDIFTRDFVIVPIHRDDHWFMGVLCYPGSLLKEKEESYAKIPRLIIMDSLFKDGSKEIEILKCYVECEAQIRERNIDIHKLKITTSVDLNGKIPGQDNLYDCGLYVLIYCEKFISNPAGFVQDLISGNNLEWGNLQQIRKRYIALLKRFRESRRLDDGVLVDKDGQLIIDGVIGLEGRGLMQRCSKQPRRKRPKNEIAKDGVDMKRRRS